MMYVEFMKKFLLADSGEKITVRLISAPWAQKRFIPTFLTWCTSSSSKIFFSPILASRWLLDSFRPPDPKNVYCYLLDIWCTSSSWKIFFSRIPASIRLLDSFRPPESKNVLFLLSRHDVRRVHEKFSSHRFERAAGYWTHFGLLSPKTFHSYFLDIWCTSSSWKILFSPIPGSRWLLDSLRPPERKNVWFLLSRYDVRRVHEKFSSRRFERVDRFWTHFGLLRPKTFDSWKIFFSPIRASRWLLDSFRPPEPKNVSLALSRHDVLRVHEKFSSRRFRRAVAC